MEEKHEQFAQAAEYYAGLRGRAAALSQEDLVAFLREIQAIYGHLPDQALETAAAVTGWKLPAMEKLIRLYPSLKRQQALHEIVVCCGGRCGQANAPLLARLEQGIAALPAGTVRLRTQNCFKQCGKGPNIQLDGVLYHRCDAEKVDRMLQKLQGKPVDL